MHFVDSHQHFWTIGGPGQSWPDADFPALLRDFGPQDLRDAADGLDLVGTVLVQSQPDDRDTDWMLETVGQDPLVLAIVGWVDFLSPAAPARIADLAAHPKFRGLRPMLQGIAETDRILASEVAPALEAMIEHDLRFDALIQPRHLSVIAELANRWPDLRIVVDHGAKPFAADGVIEPWKREMAALAEMPQVFCKLSGLRTEQTPGQLAEALRPYAQHLATCFGDRLMFGSDWPVLLLMEDSYADWVDAAPGLPE